MANSSYTIANGDTLSGIAQRNNTTTQALLAANPNITNPNLIVAGRTLNIPGVTPAAPVAPTAPVVAPPASTGAPASPTTTPGGTPTSPIATSPVRRYTGTGKTSADAEADAYYNGLDTTAPDRTKIYNEQLAQMQAQIDAINNVYTGLIAKENVAGQGRNGQTRAVNSRSGILGDDFGNANKAATEDYNAAKVEDLNRKKSLEIQSILTQVQQRADAQFEKANELSLANKEKKLAYHQELQKESRQNLADLAKTGVTLDQLSQDEYNQLVEQTGYDDLEFESIFNAAKTAREKVDYNYTNIGGGRVLRTGKDGRGMAVEEKIFDYGIPSEYDIKETKDGTIWLFDKATGNMIRKSGGPGPDGGTTSNPAVDAWVQNIKNGTAKFSDVPNDLSNAVSVALSKAANTPSALKSQAIDSGTELLRQIEEEARKSGFNSAVGNKGLLSGNLFGLFGKKDEEGGGAGTKRANFNQQFSNFSGLLQLDAAKYLKGQGQITESERRILQNAATNLSLGLKPEQFTKNLKEILTTLQSLDAKNAGATPTSGGIKDQVQNAGYDYEAMKADGLSDEQIKASLGL